MLDIRWVPNLALVMVARGEQMGDNRTLTYNFASCTENMIQYYITNVKLTSCLFCFTCLINSCCLSTAKAMLAGNFSLFLVLGISRVSCVQCDATIPFNFITIPLLCRSAFDSDSHCDISSIWILKYLSNFAAIFQGKKALHGIKSYQICF